MWIHLVQLLAMRIMGLSFPHACFTLYGHENLNFVQMTVNDLKVLLN